MAATASGVHKQKPVLEGVTVAVAGNLGPGWTDADVARWLTYNGGRFAASVTDDVTHLLCTPEEYSKPKKKQDVAVRDALRRGHKHVHIVVKDWLEDSLHKRSRRREKAYLLRQIHRSSQQFQKEEQERRERLHAKGQQLGQTFVDTTLYHIYRDNTGFSYKVTIQRDHEDCGIFGERYVLYLFESNARPHLYWFAARHYKSRTHTRPRDYRPSDTCQLFATEIGHFCAFFARKTGSVWDERMEQDREARVSADGTPANLFQYVKPVGFLHVKNMPRSDPEGSSLEEEMRVETLKKEDCEGGEVSKASEEK